MDIKAEEEEAGGFYDNIPAFVDVSFSFHPCLAVKFSIQFPCYRDSG
jgi:hypothetical protein